MKGSVAQGSFFRFISRFGSLLRFGIVLGAISFFFRAAAQSNFDPIFLGAWTGTTNPIQRVAVSNGFAYIPQGSNGVQVVDISNPVTPKLVGTCVTPGFAVAIAIAGEFAYVADWDAGLQIIQITDPTNPRIVSHLDSLGSTWDVAVANGIVYLASGRAGGFIVDVRSPAEPKKIASLAFHSLDSVAVSKNFACFVYESSADESWYWDFLILDVSNPSNPTLGSWLTGAQGFRAAVAAQGDFVYVAQL